MGEHSYYTWAERNFPESWAKEVIASYPLTNNTPFWAASGALTDYIFKCPTQRASRYLTTTSGPSVFEYNFIVDPVGSALRPAAWGYHGDPCTAGRQGVGILFDVMFFLNFPRGLATDYEKAIAAQ